MSSRTTACFLALLATAISASAPRAQSNTIPGLDVSLGRLDDLRVWGQAGGNVGISMSTTSCNLGNQTVPFLEAGSGVMQENHPFIAFLIARERDGRFEQISDRSHVKHAFCALSESDCTQCTEPQFPVNCTFLGIGCSDTYNVFNNGDQFYLGPAAEIDPWLGTWEASCSYFDTGDPAVNPPNDCNGSRSLSSLQVSNFNQVKSRVRVASADFQNPGGTATFYYAAHYVVRGEAEGERENNLGSRRLNATPNGSSWTLSPNAGTPLMNGSILNRWSGASVDSGSNGTDDGRVYVGVRVTGPVDGRYHYEYALHSRDNARGIRALRLPTCSGARFFDVGFSDVDGNANNDWTFSDNGNEIVFETTDNPLRWNTIYNFWFDSDAAPEGGVSVALDQFDPGAGAGSFTVPSLSPIGLYNVWLGDGCSNGTPPELFATGSPARASIGNGSFGLASTGNEPDGFAAWLLDFDNGALDLGNGCTYFGGGLLGLSLGTTQADSTGRATLALPIPADPSLEGANVNLQVLSLRLGGGPLGGFFDLSNGLRVRMGDSIAGCR